MIEPEHTLTAVPRTAGNRDVLRVKQLIQERCGLCLQDHELKGLVQAVSSRMHSVGIGSMGQYVQHLTGPDGREFMELLNCLTVRHTYFLRDKGQFRALEEVVLPQHLEAAITRPVGPRKPTLRIWSAGCSTGEEPYSIAMVVADCIRVLGDWDIQILATDVSTQAIEVARRGFYGERAVKFVDPARRRKYLVPAADPKGGPRYQIREDLRKLVRFSHHNLRDGTFPREIHLIFCRNVLIYFDRTSVKSVIGRFHDSLVDGGHLFMGPSEGLLNPADGFSLIDGQDAVYYQKASRRSPATPKAVQIPTAEVEIHLPAAALPPLDLGPVEQAVRDKDYERALALLGPLRRDWPNRIEPFYWAAYVHANRGDHGRAKEELEQLLRIDTFHAPAYHLRGTIHLHEQDLDLAEAALKKAVFLDRRFAMAYLTLAMVYGRQGKAEKAVREYRNAAALLSEGLADEEVPYSGGFTRATLAGVCMEAVECMEGSS